MGRGRHVAVEGKDELGDDAILEQVVAAIEANPGRPWGVVEKATPGVGRDRRNALRDVAFAAGLVVNVRRKRGEPEVALAYWPGTTAHLYVADHPEVSHLLPARGADGEQIAPVPGGGENLHLLRAPRPLRGEQGGAEQSAPPADSELADRLLERHADLAGEDPS